MKIANKKARQNVQNLIPFKGSNLFSENKDQFYVVYSYGYHYPMLVFDGSNSQWYRNSDKYSVSTSKQMGQATPFNATLIELSTKELKDLIEGKTILCHNKPEGNK